VLNWSNGWRPSLFQGTVIRPVEPRILNLDTPEHFVGRTQADFLELLQDLNRRHLRARRRESELDARIANLRLAARMQTAAREALDIGRETAATHALYELDRPESRKFGTRCLIARRLVERGVRFVQLFTKNQYSDHHGSIRTSLPASCLKVDVPAAALVQADEEANLAKARRHAGHRRRRIIYHNNGDDITGGAIVCSQSARHAGGH